MRTAKIPAHMFVHPNHLNGNACYTCSCGEWHHNGSAAQAEAAWKRHDAKSTPVDAHPLDDPSTAIRARLQLVAGYLSGAAYPVASQLDHVTTVLELAEQHRGELVARARAAGLTWTEIGQQIGMTKQAAQQRYGKKPTGPRPDPADVPLPLT